MENTFKSAQAIDFVMADTVTISKDEYNDLKYKEFVYDLNRKHIEHDIKEGNYVSPNDRALYKFPFKEETDRAALERIRARLEKELEESGVE